ncbi:hypothetical protein CTRI78_v010464 [Colletotrichum trifolii]|uniref:Transcription factor Iwr1 domain-containing protein n=1 Tax=Colletotrichum trifolii TaxID=5466 RepID=A0A4R8QSU0_COLTR|nr:hypothetical protein CTRI78_v010464 [Colletotrichum trifolii]
MTAPPQLIHIKRKRGDEDAPVTYLQELEPGSKRHMTSSWVYRRRIAAVKSRPAGGAPTYHSPVKPVIKTSKPGDERTAPNRSPPKAVTPRPESKNNVSHAEKAASETRATTSPGAAPQRPSNASTEPRRFHMSRSAMTSPTGSTMLKAGGVSKRGRYGTAVFVERGKKKSAKRLFDKLEADQQNAHALAATQNSPASPSVDVEMGGQEKSAPKRPLAKRPPRSNVPDVESQRKPMPSITPTQDMSKIASDMDQWVLHEIGLNLKSMKLQAPKPPVASPSRFKPKAPAMRYAERHPETAQEAPGGFQDELMSDASYGDDDDDDYVIEVYELAPSKPVLANIPPEEIGVLQFDSQEDMELFYGNEDDDSDYDDDEDENAENHYTADYPEDEVDSEDEFDRHAYLFRNVNASDDEEYDIRDGDEDENMYAMEGDERRDEEDVFQDKIRRYIRQHGSN